MLERMELVHHAETRRGDVFSAHSAPPRDLGRPKASRRIGEACVNLLLRQSWVVLNQLVFGPTIGETFDDELDRQTGAGDDRLAQHHVRICADQLLPVGHVRVSRIAATLRPVRYHEVDGSIDGSIRLEECDEENLLDRSDGAVCTEGIL